MDAVHVAIHFSICVSTMHKIPYVMEGGGGISGGACNVVNGAEAGAILVTAPGIGGAGFIPFKFGIMSRAVRSILHLKNGVSFCVNPLIHEVALGGSLTCANDIVALDDVSFANLHIGADQERKGEDRSE
jgi:hypothetical protein